MMTGTMPSPRSQVPRRIRWLGNVLGVVTLGWTAYCIFAWATHSGAWKLTWNTIASHQRAVPDSLNVAFTAWGIGLGIVFGVAWPIWRLLRRGAATA
jgi:hypothetical protein